MFTTTKIKWLASLLLAGILLVLSMMGGRWGTIAAAQAVVNAAPVIHSINPFAVPAGSPDRVMIIDGANFGTNSGCLTIWLKDLLGDYPEYPKTPVYDSGMSVVIHANLLAKPNQYILAVIKGNCYSIPPIPPNPLYDEVSNTVEFTVFAPRYTFLPILAKP